MDFVITSTDPLLDDIGPDPDDVYRDHEWWLTAQVVDDNGDPILDPNTGDPYTFTGNWWTSGAWNYYPPQAYNPATGNRYPQWEDPPESGHMTSDPRMATQEEIAPYLREAMQQPFILWQLQHPNP